MAALMQKALAVLIFIGAITAGMQLGTRAGGQVSPPASTSTTDPSQQSRSATDSQGLPPMMSGMPSPSPTPENKPFVPSEVEAYAPIPTKIDDPRMILHTSMGDITIRLFPAIAPMNVRNIIQLARGERDFVDVKTSKKVRRPFYDGLTFHRVIPGFVIQTGCPFGNGRGGPGYTVPDEFSAAARFSSAGMVAMAPQRHGTQIKKDSNGSQFFITLEPMPDGNDKYTIIGQVESGMDVVRSISRVRTGPTDRPIRRVFINNVEIIDRSGLYDRKAITH